MHDHHVDWLGRIARGWKRHREIRVAYAVLLWAVWLWGIAAHWNVWVTTAAVLVALAVGLLLLMLARRQGDGARGGLRQRSTDVDNTAQIVVRRPPGGYRDRLRSYWIEVDGVRVGKVKRGREAQVWVPPGPHEVRASIDWLGSPTVRVEAVVGQPVHLTVEPGGNTFQAWQMFKHDGYLKLSVA